MTPFENGMEVINQAIFKRFSLFTIIGLSFVAVFNVADVIGYIPRSEPSPGLVDFHSYWYSGQYVLQGSDPYEAYLKDEPLHFPIVHVDGVISTEASIRQRVSQKETVPANTAPIVLLLTSLSLFSWRTAGAVWIVCNLVLGILVPYATWICIKKYVPYDVKTAFCGLLFVMFMSLNSVTRGIMANGQTTLLVLFLMIVSLLALDNGKEVLAGILLGLAMSKYSVALPVFIITVYRKRILPALVAIVVQVVAALVLAGITGSSVPQIFVENIEIALMHTTRSISSVHGIHLSGYMPPDLVYSLAALAVASIAAGIGLIPVLMTGTRKSASLLVFGSLSLLTTSLLLGVYHLGYDACMVYFSLVFVLFALYLPGQFQIDDRLYSGLVILFYTSLAVLIVPGSIFRRVFDHANASSIALTLISIVLLLSNILLLYRHSQALRQSAA